MKLTKKQKQFKKAFTIIELVIVIATIAVLAGVIIKSATEKSRSAKMQTEVTQFVDKFMDGLVKYDNSSDTPTGSGSYNIMTSLQPYITGSTNWGWANKKHKSSSMLTDPKTNCRMGADKYAGRYRVFFYCPIFKGRSNDTETNKQIEVIAYNAMRKYGHVDGVWGSIHGSPAYKIKYGDRCYEDNWNTTGGSDHDGMFFMAITPGMIQ